MKRLYHPLINFTRKSLVLASEIALVSWTLITLPFYKYPGQKYEDLEDLEYLERMDNYSGVDQRTPKPEDYETFRSVFAKALEGYDPKRDLLSKGLDHGFPNPGTYALREEYFTAGLDEYTYSLIKNNNPNHPK